MMKVFPAAILAFCIILALGFGSSLGASDYASQEEIQISLRQAMKSLKSRDVETRLKGAQTVQVWARFAAPFVPELARFMNDSDSRVRAGVAYSLEAIGPSARGALPVLGKALSDGSPEVVAAAAFALGSIGHTTKDALSRLERAMKSDSPRVLLAASFAILRAAPNAIGPQIGRSKVAKDALQLLFSSLEQEPAFDAARLARAIGVVDPAVGLSAVPELIRRAESGGSAIVGSNAAAALQALREPLAQYGSDILRAARGSSGRDQLERIKEIGWLKIDSPDTIAFLRRVLLAGALPAQTEAATSLGSLKVRAKPALRDLVKAAHSENKGLRSAAAEAILEIDPETLHGLLLFLRTKDPKLADDLQMKEALSSL